jgi:hypothetical protein
MGADEPTRFSAQPVEEEKAAPPTEEATPPVEPTPPEVTTPFGDEPAEEESPFGSEEPTSDAGADDNPFSFGE